MKRRAISNSDSLDLLLDAVTNAFGGILFLAILIVLLVSRRSFDESRQTRQEVDAESSSISASQLEEVLQEIEMLETGIREQEATLQRLRGKNSEGIYSQILSLQEILNGLQTATANNTASTQSLLLSLRVLEQDKAKTQLKIEQDRNELTTLKEKLAEIERPEIRMARVPKLRRTAKSEFPIIVRYGRVYLLHKTLSDGYNHSLNTSDFLLIKEQSSIVRISPKPYAGLPIDDDQSFADAIGKKIEELNPSRDYLALVVWDDSFQEFNEVRNSIVKLGFDYRIIPIEDGGFIQEGSISEAYVQ